MVRVADRQARIAASAGSAEGIMTRDDTSGGNALVMFLVFVAGLIALGSGAEALFGYGGGSLPWAQPS